MAELTGRQVYRDRYRRQAGVLPRPVLCACRPQDPFADRLDQARFLCQRDELVGRHHPQLGVLPAYQRLGAGDFPPIEVNLRLILKKKFLPLDRAAQAVFQHQPLVDPRVDLLRIKLEGISSELLGAVHGGVRVLQYRFPVGTVLRVKARADAAGDVELALPDRDRLGDGREDPFDDLRGVFVADLVGQHDDELIAALARRTQDPRRSVTDFSSWSPVLCPRLLLMYLKLSMSTDITATCRP